MKRLKRAGYAATWAFAVLVLGGCGGDGLVEVCGNVTFDGKPVEQGTISFLPVDGEGPTAGALIGRQRGLRVPTKEGILL